MNCLILKLIPGPAIDSDVRVCPGQFQGLRRLWESLLLFDAQLFGGTHHARALRLPCDGTTFLSDQDHARLELNAWESRVLLSPVTGLAPTSGSGRRNFRDDQRL